MIKLNDKYSIDFDTYNIMLRETKVGATGKHIGEERFEIIGYCTNFETLAKFLIEREIKINGETFETLNDIINLINNFKEEISEKCHILTTKYQETVIPGENQGKEEKNEEN